MASYQNARVYWEMFDGTDADGQDNLWVRAINMKMQVGGYQAASYPYFQVSVYGRKYIDSPNLVTLYQETIGQTSTWRTVNIAETNTDNDVRCIVVKVESKYESFVNPDSEYTKGYADQYDTADLPPWGVRIKEAHIYGSQLGRNVRPDLVLDDILDNPGFTYSGPVATWVADQLCFSDIPYDRRDALDDINGMLGWNYACWDGSTVVFSYPESGTARSIAADDPRSQWSIDESLDEVYNKVRVCYGNKKGKLREVIVEGDVSAIGMVRAETLLAPESIKSEKAAIRFGQRYLDAHEGRQTYGHLTYSGKAGGINSLDPLLIRPGDTIEMTGTSANARMIYGSHEVTHVTLRPLEWSADVEFGANSKRFDTWLARLAVGAKSIKRR